MENVETEGIEPLEVEEAKALLLEKYEDLPETLGLPFSYLREICIGPFKEARVVLDEERPKRDEIENINYDMKAEELREYLQTPTEENLNQLKSSLSKEGMWVDSGLSPIGNSYLKNTVEDKLDKDNAIYERLEREQKIFETPGEVWEQAVEKLPEEVKVSARSAQRINERKEYLKHLETLKIEGEATLFEDKLENNIEKLLGEVEERIEDLKEDKLSSDFNLRIFNLRIPSGARIGRFLERKNYLEENGIDGYAGFDEPLYFLVTSETEGEHYVRFFEMKDGMMEGPSDIFKEKYENWQGSLIEMGYSVQKVDEQLRSGLKEMTVGNSLWREVKDRLEELSKGL